MRILVVEDDRLLNNTLCYNLNTAGYAVDSALTKSAAGSFLTEQDYDLIVLDVNLPDGNGFDFCREVKERRPDTAIIFLTANDMESDMLKGYELGAEDYVTKPFPMSVFQKKLAVVLGRLTKQYGGDTYEDGTLTINFSEMSATLSGKPLTFTPLEYRLLKILMKNPQIVLTRQVLLEKLRDADGNFVDEHALTAAISRPPDRFGRTGAGPRALQEPPRRPASRGGVFPGGDRHRKLPPAPRLGRQIRHPRPGAVPREGRFPPLQRACDEQLEAVRQSHRRLQGGVAPCRHGFAAQRDLGHDRRRLASEGRGRRAEPGGTPAPANGSARQKGHCPQSHERVLQGL